jgi:predicted porin
MRRSLFALVAAAAMFIACASGATAFGQARAGRKPSHHAKGTGSHRHRGGKSGKSPTTKPGKPIAVGFGFRPQVLVDEAGVA